MDIFEIITISLFIRGLHLAAPLAGAALGGLICERNGIINIGLEGLMLTGAFAAACVSFLTYSPWLALLFSVCVGIGLAFLLGLMHIKFGGDIILAGLGLNLIALGLTTFLSSAFFGTKGGSPSVEGLSKLGPWEPLTYLALIVFPILIYVLLFKTKLGTHMRATGKDPFKADTSGINVFKMKYLAIMLSGALAAFAGAELTLGFVSRFTRGMTAGRGFIAIAAYIFGRWHPFWTLGSCVLIGMSQALCISLQGIGLPIEPLLMMPYIITLIILGLTSIKGRVPFAYVVYKRK
ncbi:MAG: ABC transporter permease [Candidatus Ranarchaeia archaeon]